MFYLLSLLKKQVCYNLVVTGIPESDSASSLSQINQFFKDQFKLHKLSVATAYRLGKEPRQGSSYSRPILVKFRHNSDRNSIWKRRKEIKQDKGGNLTRIQPDFHRQLREDFQIMYRVVNAASTYEDFHTAEVKDYKLLLNGPEFSPWDLEDLPEEIRPQPSQQDTQTPLLFSSQDTPASQTTSLLPSNWMDMFSVQWNTS